MLLNTESDRTLSHTSDI